MNSTFYNDGFNDAKNGFAFSSPDIFIYLLEYTNGYNDAKKLLTDNNNCV